MINFSALREAFNASLIKKACAIANSKKFKGGDYDHAYAAIEKLKKGLADEPKVAACLKKANESIALAEDDLEEGVSVDMRTKGYKEAIARSIAKEGKKKLKAENAKTLQDANNALLGKNENMTASGNDSTGPIAGHDKPLSKKKKIMKFKGFKESVELEEVFNQAQMKKAIGIARKSRGNYDKAYAEIEKIKKGLGDEDIIAYVLKKANESVDEAYDRGSIRDFKVGDKVKFVDDKSSHHGQTGKITKLIGGIGARQKAHVKLDKTKKTVIDILTSTDLIKESVDLDEGFSLSKKGQYDLQVVGKTTVGVTLSLRHKGKQIITGTKKDGMFIMAFEKHNERNKLPKGAEIVKKGKWMHIGFKKADDVIAYAKSQGFVADMKGINEAVERKSFKELRGLIEAKAKGFVGAVRNEKYSMALLIDGVDERDGTRGTRDAMDKIKAFQKTAKKTYAGAKGKGTIPAVKKEIKLQGATQYYAKWQSDSSSYKDDSVEIWFTK